MSKWKDVGNWLQDNAGTGAALVGSLLTGNVPGAIAFGVSLVSSATGQSDPGKVLESLQTDPSTIVRLRELAVQEEVDIRNHLKEITRLELEDAQKEHHETQETIRNGDNAEGKIRWNRPGMAWFSLIGTFVLIGFGVIPVTEVQLILVLLSATWAYMGLRQIDKSFGGVGALKSVVKSKIVKAP